MVHGAGEGQLQGGAWNVAIMWGPPPVHAAPQLGHDQCALEAVGNGHSCSHLQQQTTQNRSDDDTDAANF